MDDVRRITGLALVMRKEAGIFWKDLPEPVPVQHEIGRSRGVIGHRTQDPRWLTSFFSNPEKDLRKAEDLARFITERAEVAASNEVGMDPTEHTDTRTRTRIQMPYHEDYMNLAGMAEYLSKRHPSRYKALPEDRSRSDIKSTVQNMETELIPGKGYSPVPDDALTQEALDKVDLDTPVMPYSDARVALLKDLESLRNWNTEQNTYHGTDWYLDPLVRFSLENAKRNGYPEASTHLLNTDDRGTPSDATLATLALQGMYPEEVENDLYNHPDRTDIVQLPSPDWDGNSDSSEDKDSDDEDESDKGSEKKAHVLRLALSMRKSAQESKSIGDLWKDIGGFRGIRKGLGDGIGDTFLEGDRDRGRRIGDILSHGAIGGGLGLLGGGLAGWSVEEPMTREQRRNELAHERDARLARRENLAGLGGLIGMGIGGIQGNQAWNNERIPYAVQDGVERFGESFQQGLDSFQDKLPGFLRPPEQ